MNKSVAKEVEDAPVDEGSKVNLIQNDEENVSSPAKEPSNDPVDEQIQKIDIQSIVGSVVAPTEHDGEQDNEAIEKAMTEMRAGQNNLIDGDQMNQADQLTNYKKDENEMDIDKNDMLSEGQEAINIAPGLEEDADI